MRALQHLFRGDRQGAQQQAITDVYQRLLGTLGLTLPGEPIEEKRETHNRYVLAPGIHGGFALTRDDGHVAGFGDVTIKGQVRLELHQRLSGLRFTQSEQNETGYLIDASLDTEVVFVDCHFDMIDGDATNFFVDVANGGELAFVGCSFSGQGTAVQNPGAAGNVWFIGCYGHNIAGWGTSTQHGAL